MRHSSQARAAGIDPDRVAELLVTLHRSGPGRRGSGYRVSASAVLTAAHVVHDAAAVLVRFNADRPDEWTAHGRVAWSDKAIDAAVVTVEDHPRQGVEPVRFGRVGERDAVLSCSLVGFPRFKLRDHAAQPLDDGRLSQYRDSHHAVGTIAVLSNRREGTLEISVPAPERDPDPRLSPWEGMSGAAVWSGGALIGLVSKHHRSDGLGRLAATRVDRWHERLTRDRLDQLRALIGLPHQGSDLVETLPSTPAELMKAGYTAQVRDIAPDVLVGREAELAELVRFCAGDEQYQWWQANPWAGKSALVAWFVLHPPAGVSVVSFFVTRRLTGQTDSDAFTEAMVDQLAAITGEAAASAATPAARDRERRRLLEQAALRVGERQERLLLVIDGLDEDEGAKPDGGKPSIASLLPQRRPDVMRVLVTSRPHPGVPGDVPGDHPLRHCTPRLLAPSPHAKHIELQARQELMEQLHGDQLQVDVIAYITASGGGLTLAELAELTRRPKYLLEGKLGSVFGRSLTTRQASDAPPDHTDRVYLFAHETLGTIAEEQLAGSLEPCHQRIHEWAESYRTRGWPKETPQYVLRPYGRLLATRADLERLAVYATDPARHDCMLGHTQGDAAALTEITVTQQLVLAQPVPDLTALGLLAIYRDRLANRNKAVPTGLPAVWVRLGQSHRGEALARSITDPKTQIEALGELVKALAGVDPDRAMRLAADAEQTARSITDPECRDSVLVDLAYTLIEAELWDLAVQVTRSITTPGWQVAALEQLFEALTKAGLWDLADQVAHTITNPDDQAEVLTTLVTALAEVDPDWARRLATDAEQAAGAITDPDDQARALSRLGSALASLVKALAGVDLDRARRLATETEEAARRTTDPAHQAEVLTMLVEALAGVDPGEAVRLADDVEQTARSFSDPDAQARTLGGVAEALAGVDPDRAMRLVAQDEQAARTITDPGRQTWVLKTLAQALAAVGFLDAAEQVARSITNPDGQAEALTTLVTALAGGNPDRARRMATNAEQAARSITDRARQAEALGGLVRALTGVGLWDNAEQIARSIASPYGQAGALTTLVRALVGVDPDRAMRLAVNAEQTARSITERFTQTPVLATLVDVLTDAGLWDLAEKSARSIRDAGRQAMALGRLAKALARIDRDRSVRLATDAEQLARTLSSTNYQAFVLSAVVVALAEAELWDLVEQACSSLTTINEPGAQVTALNTLVEAAAEMASDRAVLLAAHAERLARNINDPSAQARGLSVVAVALAEAGLWDLAEKAAHTITEPDAQVRVLSDLVKILAKVEPDRAVRLARDAEQVARSVSDPQAQIWTRWYVVEALAKVRLWDLAGQIARSIPDARIEAWALGDLVTALVEAELWDLAEQTARNISDPRIQTKARSRLIRRLAGVDLDRAMRLAADAEQTAHRIADTDAQLEALTELVNALAPVDPDWPVRLAANVDEVAQTITNLDDKGKALLRLARALVEAGLWERAERVARSITEPARLAEALAVLVKTLAEVDPERAARLAIDAEQLVRGVDGSSFAQEEALLMLAKQFAEARLWDQAEKAASSIASAHQQAKALIVLVRELAEAGLWERAEQTARSITDPDRQARAMSAMASAFAEAGLWERAEQTAGSIVDSEVRARAYAKIARVGASLLELPHGANWLRLRACRSLATALAAGEWLTAMPAMAKLSPSGVAAVYKALCAVSL
jgi:lipopolysaccharide biosynthesis regulator YciM